MSVAERGGRKLSIAGFVVPGWPLHEKPAVGQDTITLLGQTFADASAGGAYPQGEEVPRQGAGGPVAGAVVLDG